MAHLRGYGLASERAEAVRARVRTCPKNCWMVGTAAPVMKKYIRHPAKWVAKNKVKSLLGKTICTDTVQVYQVGQDSRQGDLRGGDTFPVKVNSRNDGLLNKMPESERLKLIEEIEFENI